jgi:hypothetical protein
MDNNECNTVIAAARGCDGLTPEAAVDQINQAASQFGRATNERFKRQGEW